MSKDGKGYAEEGKSVGGVNGEDPEQGGQARGIGNRLSSKLMTHTFEALKIRDFRTLWFGFLGSWTGMQFQQVARGYLAYKLTGSAFAIGLVTLAMGLPRIFLSPIGGYLADRFNKRDVIVWTSLPMTILSIITGFLYIDGHLTIAWLVVLGFIQGITFAFLMPARQAFVPQVVGTGHLLPNAVALNNAGMNLTRVAGPSIAGLLIAVPHFGLGGTFFVAAGCWMWVTWSAMRVAVPGAPVGKRQRVGASVKEGFRYVRSKPAIMVLLSLGFVPLALGMPYINLMPAVADGPLHGGSALLGILLSIGGVGSLAGTLLVASLSRYPKKAVMQLTLGISFGLALVGFSYFVRLDEIVPSIPFLFLAGMTGDAYQALNSSLIMMSTEASQYGRVMGVFMMAQSIRPISIMPISAVADAITTPVTLLFAGAIVSVFVAGVAIFYPGYRQIGRDPLSVSATAEITVIPPGSFDKPPDDGPVTLGGRTA